jgi:UDP-N-acetylmuramate dehydrogenase
MKIIDNFDLTDFNGYRLKSTCNRAFFPETEKDILFIYKNYPGIKILLGSGHNIILSESHYETYFIIIRENFSVIEEINNNEISVQAGTSTVKLCEYALSKELSGLEAFYDIPSTIGGAIVMNAGASGEEIKDFLIKVRYLDLQDNVVKELSKEEIEFEYRNSFFQKNKDKIVLKAWFNLPFGDYKSIKEKMENIKAVRWAKQPRDFPNCGSVFKRPQGKFVGPMIEELGLKGFKIGGAQISKKHAGFIVNCGNATGKDIIDLINEVKKRVYDKFGLLLEVEQRII